RRAIGAADATAGSALYSGRGSPTLAKKRVAQQSLIREEELEFQARQYVDLRSAHRREGGETVNVNVNVTELTCEGGECLLAVR
ncbi:hypothetical protein AB0I69_42450, partial [Streptomyces sp. NPDC050508]|uniref:hypothetical protein n=1 Tax=Streptomyces sp. NPDC050508 TaxID=3155405 RepID=UPI003423CC71